MLLRYGLSNFTSIREFQELSLVAGAVSDNAGAVIEVEGLPYRLLRVAAIYGPNASGKSNVIAGLRFMRHVVRDSQNKWVPGAGIDRHPFALDDSRKKPSEFSIDFLLQGTRYEYSFAIDDTRILHE